MREKSLGFKRRRPNFRTGAEERSAEKKTLPRQSTRWHENATPGPVRWEAEGRRSRNHAKFDRGEREEQEINADTRGLLGGGKV